MIAPGVTYHPPWLIVAGGVNRLGGTDKANLALLEYLLEKGVRTQVVTHRIDDSLRGDPNLRVEIVPIPAGSSFLGEKLLSARGRKFARKMIRQDPATKVIVNGGNCVWPGINWVHRVHHAWAPSQVSAPFTHRLKHKLATHSAKHRESINLRIAQLVIANSNLTRRHILEFLNIDPQIVHTLYLGTEVDWAPPTPEQREAARRLLNIRADRPLVVFVGALGYDRNKGLDTLWQAWQNLCHLTEWDADLLVAGDGRALPQWQATVASSTLSGRVRFLGFTEQVAELLAAADLLVSPVRYESFGLNVQESLCRGVPAIVSAGAGVAELYPPQLRELLLPNPEDADDLAKRMLSWRSKMSYWREQTAELSISLRKYTWRNMAEAFYALVTSQSGMGGETSLAKAETYS